MRYKLIIFPIWNCGRTEKFLCDMERKGYRLDHIIFRFLFVFRNCMPKSVQYFFSYSYLKEYEMGDCDAFLKRYLNADVISVRFTPYLRVFRIPDAECDLSDCKAFRVQYLRRMLLQKILLSAFLFACLLCICILGAFQHIFWILAMCIVITVLGIHIAGLIFLSVREAR